MLRLDCDVLVIGGGGAALRAAIEAHETLKYGRVILATKGKLGQSGVTATACSDRMAFHATLPHTEPGGKDAWKYHADDIYRIGGYVSDADLAGVLAQNSQEAFEYLDSLGVPFIKEDGLADQFVTDGSKYARACYTGPHTANHIEEALVNVVKALDLEVVDGCMMTDLIVSENEKRVVGALGISQRRGTEEVTLFRAKAVVLATGGAGKVYKASVFPEGATGDGYAMAYRAGAELVNMELIQIGLCSVKTGLACSGSLMRALPRIVDGDGREFLKDHFPRGTSLSRIHNIVFDKGASWPAMYGEPSVTIDIAAFREMGVGRSIWLDLSRNPEGLDFNELRADIRDWYAAKGLDLEVASNPLERLNSINPDSVEWFKNHGIDLAEGQRIGIAPSVQHFQGGVKIGKSAQTSLEGLYAAGEVAGGQHGAKRPGGNSLLDCQVFGKIAGRSAAEVANRMRAFPFLTERKIQEALSSYNEVSDPTGGLAASQVRREIQRILSAFASVIRTREGLERGLDELSRLKDRGLKSDSRGIPFALETLGMFDTAEMIMRTAMMRDESRGCHLFFKDPDDQEPLGQDDKRWRRYIVIRKGEDGMRLEIKKPVEIDWLGRLKES